MVGKARIIVAIDTYVDGLAAVQDDVKGSGSLSEFPRVCQCK